MTYPVILSPPFSFGSVHDKSTVSSSTSNIFGLLGLPGGSDEIINRYFHFPTDFTFIEKKFLNSS